MTATPGAPQPVPQPPVEPQKKRRSLFWRLVGWTFAFGLISTLAVIAAVSYYVWEISKDLPNYEVLAQYEPRVMTRVHANNGSLLAEYAKERRIYVPITAMPDKLVQAFLSAEDKDFYDHSGIDPRGIMRAVIVNVRRKLAGGGGGLVGASTITQQVAKNFLLTSEQKMERKVKEAILALRIEQAFTKNQILELYLNEIYLGLHSYGVAATGLNYFGKALNELELQEIAYIAALPKAPNNYHPFRKTKRAIARRNWVIDRMVVNGYVTPEEAATAKAKPLGVNPRPFGVRLFEAQYFTEEVRRELMSKFGEKKLYGGGLSVRTTLQPKIQKIARKALVEGLVGYDVRHGWRGTRDKIEDLQNWGKSFSKIKNVNDILPWKQVVVLNVQKDRAVVGIRPGKDVAGRLVKEREVGVIYLHTSKWAKRIKKIRIDKKGRRRERFAPTPNSMSQVVSAGDVIFAEPFDSWSAKNRKKKAKRPKKAAFENGQTIKEWRLRQIPKVGGGVLVMDPHTGRILALVGGFSYQLSQFNRATQAVRQPGSSFKPFVYATALDNGYTPSTVVLDAPIVIKTPQGLWKPKNYGGRFAGPSTLRLGIEHSKNLMTVRMAQDLGMPLISEYSKRFGVYSNLPPLLSMSLGAGGTTLQRVATGYAMLANGGKQIKPTLIDRIQDRYGRTVWRHDERQCSACNQADWINQPEPVLPSELKQIIDPHTSYQVTSMLEGVVLRGTAKKSLKKLRIPLAGKTGTTNNEKDAWFVGYSPDLVVGVYVGFDNPQPMGKGETGGQLAAPIFGQFMKEVHKDRSIVPFRIPDGIKLVRINRKTGARTSRGDPNGILESFKPGESPPDFAVSPGTSAEAWGASPASQDDFGGLY